MRNNSLLSHVTRENGRILLSYMKLAFQDILKTCTRYRSSPAPTSNFVRHAVDLLQADQEIIDNYFHHIVIIFTTIIITM